MQKKFEQNYSYTIESLNKIKEKIIGELMSYFKNYSNMSPPMSTRKTQVEIDLVRDEIEKKFNYTIELMYHRLTEEMQMVRNEQENQLSQFKHVLKELDARYMNLLSKIGQEETNLTRIEESGQKKSSLNRIESTFSDEHVSFKALEEYVHRTLQVFSVYSAMQLLSSYYYYCQGLRCR